MKNSKVGAARADGQSCVQGAALPLAHLSVLQRSCSLAGRLAGQLLADQGAQVFAAERPGGSVSELDGYLDRGKTLLPVERLDGLADADLVILDGAVTARLSSRQIVLGFTSVVPGDQTFDVPDDASDDLLNSLAGFYTDLGVTSRLLGREVIYTPLPLCSVYAGVLAVSAVCAALVQRERTGVGASIVIPRLSAGLSAIGVLAMSVRGIKPHLVPPALLGLPEELASLLPRARESEEEMLRFVNRLNPTAGCYRTSDGRLVMPVTTVNRRLAQAMLVVLGLEERAKDLGVVNVSPYFPENVSFAQTNLAVPQAMRADISIALADDMAKVFATQTAEHWEAVFAQAEVPLGIVETFDEWMTASWAQEAGLVVAPIGVNSPQLGRAVNIHSARPYPPLRAAKTSLDAVLTPAPSNGGDASKRNTTKPLDGYTVLDMANVIAGPACGRILGELGAHVVKVDTTRPDHQPLVTVDWGAEASQGKQSILLDLRMDSARDVLHRLIKRADILVMNETDAGVRRLGLTQDAVAAINPATVVVQVSAFKGEFAGAFDDRPGYDPLLQAIAGIMSRFGTPGLPLLHGIASCVDYLTGYLGAFSALTALQARERNGGKRGDWAETSLASAASLVQFPFQWTSSGLPECAVGPKATGPNQASSLLQQADGWIFVEANGSLPELTGLSVNDAIAEAKRQGARAVPVQTIAKLRERFLEHPSSTVSFRQSDCQGLEVTLLEPTWFQFDGAPLGHAGDSGRPGADADSILAFLGIDPAEITRMKDEGAVGEPDWMIRRGASTS
ncbi:coA transferase [Pandoraea anapnoica]|uniref:CoA transferase n=1 Tax=Pandoraea anapnoica TaxID=2508301 RepID=A0A5E5AMX1_9BURK|nr:MULTISPECIES: CoA transferase [Pandoraea]VVE58510.1 coA transferase [Pandoraea iniqua]VVE75121.1 coA transferase [Pandoraea anapnoica]